MYLGISHSVQKAFKAQLKKKQKILSRKIESKASINFGNHAPKSNKTELVIDTFSGTRRSADILSCFDDNGSLFIESPSDRTLGSISKKQHSP
jgi:hypothetical protein